MSVLPGDERAVRVVLAHGQPVIREALCRALSDTPELEAVGASGNVAEAVAAIERLHPDVLLVDMGLPEPGVGELIRRVVASQPDSRVLALGDRDHESIARTLIRSGAAGYVATSCSVPELVQAIVTVGHGGRHPAGAPPEEPVDEPEPDIDGSARLGRREMQVLRLVAEGHRSAAIAARLDIAPATVDTHRRNIMRKLGMRSVAELTKYAIRRGITDL